jgi:hypothetical protein
MQKISIKEDEKVVRLENIPIRGKQLIPDYQISTVDSIETFMDSEGVITGYRKTKATTSQVTLKPDEFYGRGGDNAEEDEKTKKK